MISQDDLLARHRPAAHLGADERADVLAAVTGRSEVMTLRPHPIRPARPARGWSVAAAAAAVVLACAAALVVARPTTSADPLVGGDVATTCDATLPASWDAARSAQPIRVDGVDATPDEGTPSGELLLHWMPSTGTIAYGLRDTAGGVQRLGTFPAPGKQAAGAATDGANLVVWSGDTVYLVDVATQTRRDVFEQSRRAGWVLRTEVAILDGRLYWGASSAGDDNRGWVVRYSIANHAYDVLADLDRFPSVVSDARGVAWPGGEVRRAGLPGALGPALNADGEPTDRMVSDGTSFGWQSIGGDQTVFRWAHGDDVRTFRVTVGAANDGAGLSAVAGPFLFFGVNRAGQQNYVLDTRSGALAPLRVDQSSRSFLGGYLFTQGDWSQNYEVDVSALPALRCG